MEGIERERQTVTNKGRREGRRECRTEGSDRRIGMKKWRKDGWKERKYEKGTNE